MLIRILCILLLAGSVSAQISISNAEVASIKLYDTTKVDAKVNTKQHTIDLDSNSFSVRSWGECAMTVDIAPEATDLSASVAPSLTSMNEWPRFRTGTTAKTNDLFVREDGHFEWNIDLASKPDTNVFTYSIETEGLDFCQSVMLLPHWLAIEMGWDFAVSL